MDKRVDKQNLYTYLQLEIIIGHSIPKPHIFLLYQRRFIKDITAIIKCIVLTTPHLFQRNNGFEHYTHIYTTNHYALVPVNIRYFKTNIFFSRNKTTY